MKYVVVSRAYVLSTSVLIGICIPAVLTQGIDDGAPWSWTRAFFGVGALGLGLLLRDGLMFLGWWPGSRTVTLISTDQEGGQS